MRERERESARARERERDLFALVDGRHRPVILAWRDQVLRCRVLDANAALLVRYHFADHVFVAFASSQRRGLRRSGPAGTEV